MFRRRREPVPFKFSQLAMYNGERGRGIVHTPEWDARMAVLQREFNEMERERVKRDPRWIGNLSPRN